ncbi:hypothetical protein [Streptomyces bacillaris]|uniref:hypothetical protein n=1 Tax=Streptomyces bacillaris TaxID=68179 RepID=UPI0034605858
MTDTSGMAARISALSTGPWAGPVGPPPEGLDLAWVWQIPVGTVRVETYSPVEAEILEARLTDPSGRAHPEAGPPVTAEDVARVSGTRPVACPSCAAGDRLAMRGRWGDPATLVCGCGYEWRLPGSRAYAVGAMTQAITLAIAQQGLPPAAPADVTAVVSDW